MLYSDTGARADARDDGRLGEVHGRRQRRLQAGPLPDQARQHAAVGGAAGLGVQVPQNTPQSTILDIEQRQQVCRADGLHAVAPQQGRAVAREQHELAHAALPAELQQRALLSRTKRRQRQALPQLAGVLAVPRRINSGDCRRRRARAILRVSL